MIGRMIKSLESLMNSFSKDDCTQFQDIELRATLTLSKDTSVKSAI